MSSALSISTAKRISQMMKATEDGSREGMAAMAQEVKELSVGKMGRHQKKAHEAERWAQLGGQKLDTTVHARRQFMGMLDKDRARQKRRFEQARAAGLDAVNPNEARRKQASQIRKEQSRDPMTGGVHVQGVGRMGRDGMLRMSKDTLRGLKQGSGAKGGEKLHQMFRKRR